MGCYVESRKKLSWCCESQPKKSNYCKLEYVIVRFIGNSLGHAADGVSRPYYFFFFAGLLNSNSERRNSSAVGNATHSFSIAFFLPFVSQAPLFAVYISIIINQQRAVFGPSDFIFLSLILMGLNTNYQVTCHVLLTALFQLHRVTYHFQRAHLELMFSIQALEISN